MPEARIPFTTRADMSAPDSVTIPGAEGYVIEVHGIYLSVQTTTYSLDSGSAALQITGLQGLGAPSEISVQFAPSATDCVNLPIPIRGRALGPGPVTLAVWGELVPVAA